MLCVGCVGTTVETVGTGVGTVATYVGLNPTIVRIVYAPPNNKETFLLFKFIQFNMGLLSKWRKKRKMTQEPVPTQEQKQDFPEIKPESGENVLKQWTKTLDMVENHPLSQARVINTAVLTDLTHVLNSMDEKLDNLGKLDKIISLLIETKKQLNEAGMPTDKVDAAITSIKGLTIKDQEALNFFKGDELLTTKVFAERADLSRSTASSRLNKLFSFGLLEKVAKGKKIAYKLKQ